MVTRVKRRGALVLRLIVGLALLGWPRVGAAQGTWSVVSLPQGTSEGMGKNAWDLRRSASAIWRP